MYNQIADIEWETFSVYYDRQADYAIRLADALIELSPTYPTDGFLDLPPNADPLRLQLAHQYTETVGQWGE